MSAVMKPSSVDVKYLLAPRHPHSPWFSRLPLLLLWTGIRAWWMAPAQANPFSPATTQKTSVAVTTSKETTQPGGEGTDSWAGPRTCSTLDRAISCRRAELCFSPVFRDKRPAATQSVDGFYLVVLGAALVLVQSDALPVQDPVMTLPLRCKHKHVIACTAGTELHSRLRSSQV